MTVQTVPHLNFAGEARAALEFYRSVFGGEATIATYGDVGMPPEAPDAGKVVFGQVVAGNGFRVMAYDVPGPGAGPAPAGVTRREHGLTSTDAPFFVSVRGETVEEVAALWAGLVVGGRVVEDFAASAWSPGSGMVTDRFGVTWVLDVAAG